MNVNRLSVQAEYFIDAMHLSSNDQAIVRKNISRYSQPPTNLKTIGWLIYRIGNAIKSIFGKSDWQQTKKIVFNNSVVLAKARVMELTDEQCLTNSQKELRKEFYSCLEITVDGLLSNCLLANDNNLTDDGSIRQTALELDIPSVIHMLSRES